VCVCVYVCVNNCLVTDKTLCEGTAGCAYITKSGANYCYSASKRRVGVFICMYVCVCVCVTCVAFEKWRELLLFYPRRRVGVCVCMSVECVLRVCYVRCIAESGTKLVLFCRHMPCWCVCTCMYV